MANVVDPIQFARLCWPHISFYEKQREIIYSVRDDDETVVPAGNMLGKDFVAAFIVLWFFLSRHPCRIVTTSVKDDHLRVLWGEIGNFIQSSKYNLDVKSGGPLIYKHHELRKHIFGREDKLSYVTGMVADDASAMQGHHIAKTGDGIARTLFVVDEASGVNDEYYKMASTWANKILIIGNPWDCSNFFKRAVRGNPATGDKGGNIPKPKGGGYYRRVIKICAEDSPNVQYGLAQERAGIEPTDTIILPGVKSYAEYKKNLQLWDKIQQCVSLGGEFYEGAENLLFPPDWLRLAAIRAQQLQGVVRHAKTLGVDSAQGGDNTAFCVCDDLGIMHMESHKTTDTSVIPRITLALMGQYGIKPYNVLFDMGGGGKQHADLLRSKGYPVRTVAFGEAATPPKKTGVTTLAQRRLNDETRYVYKNRRAEMYGMLHLRLEPRDERPVFAVANEWTDLINQLAPIPKRYDEEGRLKLPPKNKKNPDSTEETLVELIGHSPDEADATVLAVYGLESKATGNVAGAVNINRRTV